MSLQSTDPIADLLTRIRNAAMVGSSRANQQAQKGCCRTIEKE